MAERRMFHTTVVESDAFLDLPHQAQLLYFHLGMHADDDGFVNGPKQIARRMRISIMKLQMLIDNGFLLEFPGVVVIRHWRVANTLRKDRMKPLQYPEFAQKLYIQSNGIYTVEKSKDTGKSSLFAERLTIWQPNGNQMRPKVREGKIREDKIREDNISEGKVVEDKISDSAESESDDHTTENDSGMINTYFNQKVIRLTPAQVRNLVDEMGIDHFAFYVEKMARFIREKDANVRSQYMTIRKWWKEDQGL